MPVHATSSREDVRRRAPGTKAPSSSRRRALLPGGRRSRWTTEINVCAAASAGERFSISPVASRSDSTMAGTSRRSQWRSPTPPHGRRDLRWPPARALPSSRPAATRSTTSTRCRTVSSSGGGAGFAATAPSATNPGTSRWVEEKTRGTSADDVLSLRIEDLRGGGAGRAREILPGPRPPVCLVNAAAFADVEVFVLGLSRPRAGRPTSLLRPVVRPGARRPDRPRR